MGPGNKGGRGQPGCHGFYQGRNADLTAHTWVTGPSYCRCVRRQESCIPPSRVRSAPMRRHHRVTTSHVTAGWSPEMWCNSFRVMRCRSCTLFDHAVGSASVLITSCPVVLIAVEAGEVRWVLEASDGERRSPTCHSSWVWSSTRVARRSRAAGWGRSPRRQFGA